MDLRVSNAKDLLDKFEEKAVQMESISQLLANAPEDLTLATVQGSLSALASIARDAGEAADRLRTISSAEG